MSSTSQRLTGKQFEELQQALLSAFPSHNALDQMITTKLERNLNAIACGANLEAVVFELIKRAESEGWTRELVRKAYEHNQGSPEMAAIAARLVFSTPVFTGPKGNVPVDNVRLRSLTPEELEQLIIVFAQCDCLSSVEYRTLLRSQLPSEVRFNTPVSNVMLQDLTAIVTTSLKFEGAFLELLRRVRFREGPTYSRADLDSIVVRLFPELNSEIV